MNSNEIEVVRSKIEVVEADLSNLPYLDPETMRLGDCLPNFVFRVGRWWTKAWEHMAEAKYRDAEFGEDWFSGWVAEAAFYRHLTMEGKWKSWGGAPFFGRPEEAGFDFITTCQGYLETIGIRGRNHSDMEKWVHDLWIPYPIREPIDIPNYVIAASSKRVLLKGQKEESTLVAFWGAMEGIEVNRIVRDNENYPPKRCRRGPRGGRGNPYKEIRLGKWNQKLLDWIVQSRDKHVPQAFLDLKRSLSVEKLIEDMDEDLPL